jgi:hypothetical protein
VRAAATPIPSSSEFGVGVVGGFTLTRRQRPFLASSGRRSPLPARIRPPRAWIRPPPTRIRRCATVACARVVGEKAAGLLACRWQLSALSHPGAWLGRCSPHRSTPLCQVGWLPTSRVGWFPTSRVVHLRFDFFDVAITVYGCCNRFLRMLHRAYRCCLNVL